MMAAIALIDRPCFQSKVGFPSTLRTNIVLRPTVLKQGFSTLLFSSIIFPELNQAIVFLKLYFVFHDLTLIHMLVL